ncbi:YiiX family permuted papain-like enzyme [Rufibacter roseolus]|uniref:YiiX family permuted papain-like enzyme n=1 Tax=Rufibacter roseolus TaxID=2817375 RepID=UPI001B31686D|nr:YiiX family permuted papain-like enzyme [Rufibacter roseolus]
MKLRSKILLALWVLLPLVAAGYFLEKRYGKPSPDEYEEVAADRVKELSASNELQNGDLIFHTSRSAQSQAIQLATKSKYSHCGIVYKNGNDYFVFEAVQPVSTTPLAKWIARGEGGHFVVKRLKNADQVLSKSALAKMKEEGQKLAGKDYDLTFEWSDEKIYCSELIWKVYQRATGLEIGKLEKLRDFDLSAKPVQAKMRERYGRQIPYEEKVISPASMFSSDLLVTVVEK